MAKIDLRIVEGIAWLASKPKRIKIAVGGRGSQKSTGFADLMIKFVDDGERICCAREHQNSIDDSVHENLKQEIDRLGVEGFTYTNNGIFSSNGGETIYKGLARNIASLKSLAGVKRLWIEEGESVSHNSLKVLTPSIRSSAADNETGEDPPEIWISMNWGHSTGAIAQKYLKRAEASLRKTGRYEDDLIMVVQVNWRDNLWFPPELEQERLDDYNNLPRSEYDSIWENEYNDSVDRAIIKPEWFDAAIDAHIKLGFEPEGAEIVSHDPSDLGRDAKGLTHRHGSVVLNVMPKDDGDVNEGCDWALDYAIENQVDVFTWDGDGMGVALRKQVSDRLTGKKIEPHIFRGSESADNPNQLYMPVSEGKKEIKGKSNKDTFVNKRAQYYTYLANRFHNSYKAVVQGKYVNPDELISISSDIECINELRAEVCKIPRKDTGNGKIQILSKVDMAKKPYELPSPNLGDSLMMSLDVSFMKKKKPKKERVPRAHYTGSGAWMG